MEIIVCLRVNQRAEEKYNNNNINSNNKVSKLQESGRESGDDIFSVKKSSGQIESAVAATTITTTTNVPMTYAKTVIANRGKFCSCVG